MPPFNLGRNFITYLGSSHACMQQQENSMHSINLGWELFFIKYSGHHMRAYTSLWERMGNISGGFFVFLYDMGGSFIIDQSINRLLPSPPHPLSTLPKHTYPLKQPTLQSIPQSHPQKPVLAQKYINIPGSNTTTIHPSKPSTLPTPSNNSSPVTPKETQSTPFKPPTCFQKLASTPDPEDISTLSNQERYRL